MGLCIAEHVEDVDFIDRIGRCMTTNIASFEDYYISKLGQLDGNADNYFDKLYDALFRNREEICG